MATLRLQPPALAAPFAQMLAALTEAGHGVWVVGGWVRDQLRGVPAHDADFCTNADGETIEAAARRAGVAVVLDRVAAVHGTYRLAAAKQVLDLARLREDVRRIGARHAEVCFTRRLELDLARRDLTINALALPFPLPANPEAALVDQHGGQADLHARVLRLIGAPARRLQEDPLRLLRIARFATLDGAWRVENATAEAMRDCAPLLASVSAERRLAELQRALASPCPARFWQLAEASGAWASLLPAEASAEARARAAQALEAVAAHLEAPTLRWASFVWAAVHGVAASEATASASEQAPHVGAAEPWLAPLGFPRTWRHTCATVVDGAAAATRVDTDPDVVRWALALGPERLALLADWARAGRHAAPLAAAATKTLAACARAEALRAGRELWTPQQMPVDPPALFVELGLPAGSARGALLQALLQHVWLHPDDGTQVRLRAVARTWADSLR